MMSHRPKAPVPRWLLMLGALVPLAGILAAAARAAGNVETRTHADSTFVRKDSLAIQQAGFARRYSVDSVAREARDARIDTVARRPRPRLRAQRRMPDDH